MTTPLSRPSAAAPARIDPTVPWAFAGLLFWAGLAWLGSLLFNANPRSAAFDLDLLVQAGRAIAAGRQPYDPAILAGVPPDAFGLFYSYPPIVGQALSPIAELPLAAIAIVWSVLAVAALAVVTVRLRDRLGAATPPRLVVTATVAVCAMALPMVIAVLFGNLDAVFPALYGLILLAAVSDRRSERIAGGIALALAALTKVYPASLGLWAVVRFLRDRGGGDARRRLVLIGAAAVTAIVVVGLSVALFGLKPWADYATVAATAARAEIVDHRNDAPAAQLALWLGADSATARLLHLPVVVAAIVATIVAAWRVRDELESLTVAAVASLFVLPISWVHYPAVLIPFGIGAFLRVRDPQARTTIGILLAAALIAAGVALLWLPILWLAIGLTLGAVHLSAEAVREDPGSSGTGESPRLGAGAAIRRA